jgi:predicted dehydrogenase
MTTRTASGKAKTVRFGLVGYGTHGQWAVVPAFKRAEGVTLAAVADLLPANLAKLDDPSLARYTDYREMLKKEQLDALYVATRVEQHAEVALAAFKVGLHVITEKPMAPSVRDCRRMIAAAGKAGRRLGVDFELRYSPGFRQIRDWIAAGLIGKVGAIHLDNMWDGHKVKGQLAERRRRFCDSSGCLDCGIHKLDLARFFNGGGIWRDIRAYGSWFGEKVRFPPHIAILARLDTGVLVTVNASFSFTAYIDKRVKGATHEGLAVVGSKGVIVLHEGPAGERHLQLVSETRDEIVPFSEHGHTPVIADLLSDFAGALLRNKPQPVEVACGTDGLMAQWCADEANRQAVLNGDSFLLKPARKKNTRR